MGTDCTARGIRASCFDPGAEPAAGASVISASVGLGGVNRANDVRVVQQALNEVSVADGGPNPTLDVDGLIGPLTIAAIAQYQRHKLGWSDSRVDPHGPTLRTLNAERQEPRPDISTHSKTSGHATVSSKGAKSSLLPNPYIVPLIESLLPDIRTCIRAANFHLSIVRQYVTTHKQQLPKGPFLEHVKFSLRLLNTVFSFFTFPNPLPVYERLHTAYRNMDAALNRSFETPELIAKKLFVPNTKPHMENEALAYTTAGGAFAGPKDKNTLGLPQNLIFICSSLGSQNRNEQIMTAIHELAHYVSPPADPTRDPQNGDYFKIKDRMDKLAPRLKIRNAEHYAAYAFLCGFHRVNN
jgi:hypothetical protein